MDFNSIAWCYDPLKRLVFSKKLDMAARSQVKEIDPGSHVLVIGGGTGEIISHIPKECHIVYVEKSLKMIHKAEKRTDQNIEWTHVDFMNFQSSERFDCVICPFFLDLFENESLTKVVEKIKGMLKGTGKLIVTDFTSKNELLLSIMYFFFRITSNVEARKLPSIHEYLSNSGFKLHTSNLFLRGMVFSNVYDHS